MGYHKGHKNSKRIITAYNVSHVSHTVSFTKLLHPYTRSSKSTLLDHLGVCQIQYKFSSLLEVTKSLRYIFHSSVGRFFENLSKNCLEHLCIFFVEVGKPYF